MRTKPLLLLGLSTILFTSTLKADTVQHVVTVPSSSVSLSGETPLAVSVPQFGGGLGTLTAVHVSVRGHQDYVSMIMNLDAPTQITAVFNVSARLRRPDSSLILSGDVTAQATAFIGMFDNITLIGSAENTHSGTLTDAADLGLFTGAGSVPLTLGGAGSVNLMPFSFGLFHTTALNLSAEVTVTYEYTVSNPALEVALDVRPGSDVNPVNLKSNGVLPVAVLSSASFSALDVDVTTVLLGDPNLPGTAAPVHAGAEDVDGDGDADLVLHFRLNDLIGNGALDVNTTQLLITGADTDGVPFSGVNSVTVKAK
ncbi:MAG: choice-of-anchor E domain-containing protein [Verrucomicrobiota bacterium]